MEPEWLVITDGQQAVKGNPDQGGRIGPFGQPGRHQGGTREAGKDHVDSLGGTREAGKDHLDSLGGTREAPGRQERTIWTA